MATGFDELAEAIAGGEGWAVTSDRPSLPKTAQPLDGIVDILLAFDGGSLGNPGQGYGSFTYKGLLVRGPTMMTFPGVTTNNQAEYQSLIGGLRALLHDCHVLGLDPAALSISVLSDSQLVVNQIAGRWKVKNAQLGVLHSAALALLQHFERWKLSWHPRSESVRILGH